MSCQSPSLPPHITCHLSTVSNKGRNAPQNKSNLKLFLTPYTGPFINLKTWPYYLQVETLCYPVLLLCIALLLCTCSSPLRRYWSIEWYFSLFSLLFASFSLCASLSSLLFFVDWLSVRMSHGITVGRRVQLLRTTGYRYDLSRLRGFVFYLLLIPKLNKDRALLRPRPRVKLSGSFHANSPKIYNFSQS